MMRTTVRKSLYCPKCNTRNKKHISHNYFYFYTPNGERTMEMTIECTNCLTTTILKQI